MYEIIKKQIENTNYNLNEILRKIYVIYSKDMLNEEELEELEALAREKANVDNSIDVINKLKEIDLRLRKLESKEEIGEPTETEEYPEYVVGKWYYKDDKVTENDKKYICIAPEGQVCTWSPSEYPAYWQEVKETAESED